MSGLSTAIAVWRPIYGCVTRIIAASRLFGHVDCIAGLHKEVRDLI